MLDVGNEHAYINKSDEDRYHIIVHGTRTKEFENLVVKSYEKMGLNKNYVVGIYDDTRHHSLTLDQKRKEITEFFTRFKYFGPIVVKQDINDVLNTALEYDVEFCIVQSIGHIIKDASFFTFIEKWIKNQKLFCYRSYNGQVKKEYE